MSWIWKTSIYSTVITASVLHTAISRGRSSRWHQQQQHDSTVSPDDNWWWWCALSSTVKTLVSHARAARPGCRELLTRLLRRTVSAQKNKSAWKELLQFGGNILAKPKRGGVNRNLSNINRRVAAWDQIVTEADNAPHSVNCRSTRKTSDATRLAATVTSKLEAGNIKEAVRRHSGASFSGDVEGAWSETSRPANDRRPPGAPDGVSRFQSLQVSSDDVRRALRSFPAGSSGGPDGLTPYYLREMLMKSSRLGDDS